MTKLSPLQQNLYDAMRQGVRVHWMPYQGRFGGAYYFRSDTMKHCTKQVEALLKRKLVEVFDENPHNSWHKVRAIANQNSETFPCART